MSRIFEWRGVKNLVAAEILCDDNETGEGHGYVTDTPFVIAGVANVSAETESSNETHYYDNYGAIVISSTGDTTVTLDVSGLEADIYAKITGYKYNQNTGAVIEGKRSVKYFAVGYQYEDSDGNEWMRYFYKGIFAIPSSTHATMNAGTDANGQSLTYTAIRTTHTFTNADNEGVKTMALNSSLNLANTSTFFSVVTTPDNITQTTVYKLTTDVAQYTGLTIKRNGTQIVLPGGSPGMNIYAGDQLQITVTGGTVTVNSAAFISGDIHIVSGNVAVVTTASE